MGSTRSLEYIDAKKFIEYLINNFNITIENNWLRDGKEYKEGSIYQVDFTANDINNSKCLYILMEKQQHLIEYQNVSIILTKINATVEQRKYVFENFKIVI